MALQGKIIALEHSKFGFEYVTTDYNKPERIRQVWPIASLKSEGMSYCRVDEAIGKPASITDGRVSCYLGNGNWVRGELSNLGQTASLSIEITPIPCPKCRRETRWHNGAWQKLMKKGWVPA
jgi:hypothetical protein